MAVGVDVRDRSWVGHGVHQERNKAEKKIENKRPFCGKRNRNSLMCETREKEHTDKNVNFVER